jgi:UDPglucose 6-dehydrogenase
MNITVIGSGYVGLVTGACLAEMGNDVTCVDVDTEKVDALSRGLKFSSSLANAMQRSNIHFIAVGTPPGEDGSADLIHVLDVAAEIGRNMDDYSLIVNKSTVPVGTADKVRETIENELRSRGLDIKFDVASNPEFLKEGAAVEDFMKPNRIIIGSRSERARSILREIYSPFTRSHERILFMPARAAEMTKYTANAMLATRISFMNEIASLCDRMGVDVEHVRVGIGSDSRIGYDFLYPGCGYGGSCFPKDVSALIHMAEQSGLEPALLRAVSERNDRQKQVLFNKITAHFGPGLDGLCFGLWGLAFKPGTDDIREASSMTLIRLLIGAGARVRAFDPVAMRNASAELPPEWLSDDRIIFVDTQYDILEDADAMVLVTEWKSFRHPDFTRIRRLMKSPVIFDGRNQYDPEMLRNEGFTYYGIGR